MEKDGSDQNKSREIQKVEEAISYLENQDISLPDGLTIEKIKNKAWGREVQNNCFSFTLERHPTPFHRSMKSPRGATPGRWHITTRYSYNFEDGVWQIETSDKEFKFDPALLLQAEFTGGRKEGWEEKAKRVRNSDNPEKTFEKEFEPVEEDYQEQLHNVPDEKVEEILHVIKERFRKLSDLQS